MKIALSIPGFGKVDSGLPTGVPRGGLFYDNPNGEQLPGIGQNIIQVLIVFAVTTAILLTLWFIVRGGLSIIQSRGRKEQFKSGRDRVLYAVFGLIMIFISFFMINIISTFFGIDLLPFLKFGFR